MADESQFGNILGAQYSYARLEAFIDTAIVESGIGELIYRELPPEDRQPGVPMASLVSPGSPPDILIRLYCNSNDSPPNRIDILFRDGDSYSSYSIGDSYEVAWLEQILDERGITITRMPPDQPQPSRLPTTQPSQPPAGGSVAEVSANEEVIRAALNIYLQQFQLHENHGRTGLPPAVQDAVNHFLGIIGDEGTDFGQAEAEALRGIANAIEQVHPGSLISPNIVSVADQNDPSLRR